MWQKLALPLLLALVAAVACGNDGDDAPTSTSGPTNTAVVTASSEPTATSAATVSPGDSCAANADPATSGDITWADIAPAEIPAPPGYAVADAGGDAPFLAVSREGEVVGNIELLQFGLPDNLDPAGGFASLASWAEDFYEGLRGEREVGGATLLADDPAPSDFGQYCGATYGYTVEFAAGDVIERYTGVVSYDPERIYLIVALYDEATPETSWVTSDDLTEFAPSLADLAAALRFPPD